MDTPSRVGKSVELTITSYLVCLVREEKGY